METEATQISEAADVTEATLKAAEDVFEGWFDNDGEPIDWYAFWDRLEAYGWTVLVTDSAAARKIQRHIRKFREVK